MFLQSTRKKPILPILLFLSLSEQILQHVKNSKIQEEILSKIPLMEKYFQEGKL